MSARKPLPQPPAKPACAVCTTPTRCGTPALGQRGPRCAGRANGPDHCDCLDACGDDPWLKNGRSQPCERMLARQAVKALQQTADAQLLADLDEVVKLIEADRLALIQCHADPRTGAIAADEPTAVVAARRYADAIATIRAAHERLRRAAG